ncbi:Aste57867_2018 [Aphanomyces stellatus]|uniref:Aste57867_2018 protein n=1 Tax=Aphanomyces stellatus TaxID=120398 RepID=A0A485KC68_9STRA|nr:hypothetical protein As57867_002015 [Aphanomyces stellatus]VFT79222.1 Aste57867_2018 [Aphanomyces stellatus]
MFAEQLYQGLLAWLDDLLGYHRTREGLLGVLEDVLVCADKGLKLHPKKCSFYVNEARWCGRIISGTGVKHDPARVEALQQLPSPVTGADLQQYVCAINWMRMSIPGYNVLVQPLTELLKRVFAASGGKRNKYAAATILLEDVRWTSVHDDCLAKTKAVLGNVVELCHPDPQQRLCVFADASESHWGAVITQVPPDQQHRLLDAQNHQPLMFLSGTFTGAAGRWAIVEKEAHAIVETLARADYLLHPAAGFNLYTDHRNLKYVIHDIPGEAIVWADLLSRWGSTLPSICAITHQPLLISLLRDDKFRWPTFAAIAEAQAAAPEDVLSKMAKSKYAAHLVVLESGKSWLLRLVGSVTWVPVAAAEASRGQGHSGQPEGVLSLDQYESRRRVLRAAVPPLCQCVGLRAASSQRGPPPYGLIDWDFVYMGDSKTGDKYLLVVKCDASKMVWLFPDHCDGLFAAVVCRVWRVLRVGLRSGDPFQEPSDRGAPARAPPPLHDSPLPVGERHRGSGDAAVAAFISGVFVGVAHGAGPVARGPPHHHACPQPAAVVVPRWYGPRDRMSGRPAMSPADTTALPGTMLSATLSEVAASQRVNIDAARVALEEMHKQMSVENERKRDRSRANHDKEGTQMAQFVVGDYVLYQDVWAHLREKLRTKWCGPGHQRGQQLGL